jgi:hypothetical protein
MKKISFSAVETIGLPIVNINFGGYTGEEAEMLVSAGKGKWALCHGNTLTFVPNDYELKMWESFIKQTSTGFEII